MEFRSGRQTLFGKNLCSRLYLYLYIGFSVTACMDDRYLFLLPKLKRPSDEDVFYLHPMVLYLYSNENRGGYTIIRFLLLTAFDE